MVKVNCSSCGTELERTKTFPKVTCFSCKKKRHLTRARLGKTKNLSTISWYNVKTTKDISFVLVS